MKAMQQKLWVIFTSILSFFCIQPSFSLNNNESIILLEKINLNNKKGSAGVLLYTTNKKGTFLLLGKERKGKSGEGTWCELGGNVEKGESFLQAAIREVKEESGNVYKLKKNTLLNQSTILSNENKKSDDSIRKEVYIFIKAPNYYTADRILKAVNKQTDSQFKEKDAFKWVELFSLLECAKNNPCVVRDIDNNKDTVQLRNFFYKALQRKEFQEKLRAII